MSDTLAIVEQFGQAWGNHDLDACLAMVTDDCVFDDRASNFEAEETFAANDRNHPAPAILVGRRSYSRHRRVPSSRRSCRGEVFVREGVMDS